MSLLFLYDSNIIFNIFRISIWFFKSYYYSYPFIFCPRLSFTGSEFEIGAGPVGLLNVTTAVIFRRVLSVIVVASCAIAELWAINPFVVEVLFINVPLEEYIFMTAFIV